MQDELISFKTAKLAYEKGFNIPQLYGYSAKGELSIGDPYEGCETTLCEDYLPATTQSLLQKWLREVHNIELWMGQLSEPNKYHVEDIVKDGLLVAGVNKGSPTYEEALEIGLQEALKLL